MATTMNNSYMPQARGSNYSDWYQGYDNFMNTGVMKAIDNITDFVPLFGTGKNAVLGIMDLIGGNTAGGVGRLLGSAASLALPIGAGAIGRKLMKSGSKAIASGAGKFAAKQLASAGYGLGLQGIIAGGAGNMLGKGIVGGIDTDLQKAKEAEQILGTDLVKGDFVRNLLNDLNSATVGEYDTYANDLAKQQEQDTAGAAYSGMNAGNVGLSNLLKGNIANNYSNLMLNAQKNLSNQKTTNRLNAYNQNDAKIQQLIDYAAQSGNNALVEKLMKARTNIYSLGV